MEATDKQVVATVHTTIFRSPFFMCETAYFMVVIRRDY